MRLLVRVVLQSSKNGVDQLPELVVQLAKANRA